MAQRLCLRGSSKSTLGWAPAINHSTAQPSVPQEENVRKETHHTHTHTLNTHAGHQHTCTHMCVADVAQRKRCTVQPSGALAGPEPEERVGRIPSPSTGAEVAQGLGHSTEGCRGPQSPKSLSQGRDTPGILRTHTTHTHKCMPQVCTRRQMPTSWTAHHGNRVAHLLGSVTT